MIGSEVIKHLFRLFVLLNWKKKMGMATTCSFSLRNITKANNRWNMSFLIGIK